MKKHIFSLLLTCLALSQAHAQFSQGDLLLAGEFGFTSRSTSSGGTTGASTTQITLAPKLGYFVTPEITVGAEIQLQSQTGSTTFLFGPFGRYYFVNTEKTGVFGQFDFLLGSVPGTDQFGQSASVSLTGFGFNLGADFFLNDNVAVEGSLGYHSYSANSNTTGVFGFNFGVAAFLGRD